MSGFYSDMSDLRAKDACPSKSCPNEFKWTPIQTRCRKHLNNNRDRWRVPRAAVEGQ